MRQLARSLLEVENEGLVENLRVLVSRISFVRKCIHHCSNVQYLQMLSLCMVLGRGSALNCCALANFLQAELMTYLDRTDADVTSVVIACRRGAVCTVLCSSLLQCGFCCSCSGVPKKLQKRQKSSHAAFKCCTRLGWGLCDMKSHFWQKALPFGTLFAAWAVGAKASTKQHIAAVRVHLNAIFVLRLNFP